MQSRFDSLLESSANIAVGFVISVGVWQVLAVLYHTRTSFGENIGIVSIFTVTSLLRQYLIRRWFNGRTVGQALIAWRRNRHEARDWPLK